MRSVPSFLALVVAATSGWIVGGAACEAASGAALKELGPLVARSTASGEVVLELWTSGGYGNFVAHEFRLYGDGCLQERRFNTARPDLVNPIEVRTLHFGATEADELVAGLVRDGVVGLDNDRLLALVQEEYPSVNSLLFSPDCAGTRIRIHLLRRSAEDAEWEASETRLHLECLGAYPRFLPGIPAARALADLEQSFFALSRAGRDR